MKTLSIMRYDKKKIKSHQFVNQSKNTFDTQFPLVSKTRTLCKLLSCSHIKYCVRTIRVFTIVGGQQKKIK